MGIFSRHVTVSRDEIVEKHGSWLALADNEPVEYAAQGVHHHIIFTDRRVVLTNIKYGIRNKTEYLSIPYKSISRWSAEGKRGLFDGADLKMWVSSQVDPIVDIELAKDESAQGVLELLALHAL